MSLNEQLLNLKVASTNIFDQNIKNKKSLYFEDGASLSRADTFAKCKEGFNKLCVLDFKFKKFKCLFNAADINQPISLKDEEEVNSIKKNIRQFLYLSTDYLEINCALQALEWLIVHYEAHLHQPEDVLIACFPLHERPVFVKFAHLLNLEKKEFSWLKIVVESGRGINQADICTICLKNPNILEMICGWPVMMLSINSNDTNTCRRLYRSILSLGINILDKMKLRGAEKIEKYMAPFVRFINDGVKSHNSDFISTASLILVYMSHNISINEDFLNDTIKRLLKTNKIKDYVCLRTVLDVVTSQDLTLSDKIKALIKVKLGKLNDEESKSIDKYMIGLFEGNDNEDMDISYPIEEINKGTVNFESLQIKDITKVKEISSFDIDWMASNIENKLIDIFKTNILTWSIKNEDRINVKVCLEILKNLRKKPKAVKFEYSTGGLVSFLCLAILSPNPEIRKVIKKIISKFIVNWPQMDLLLKIGKHEIINDINCLKRGEVALIIMNEINYLFIPELSETISLAALSMINKDTLCNVPTFENIWKMFLSLLSPSENKSNILHEEAIRSLFLFNDAFLNLQSVHQHAILDSILSGLNSSTESINGTTNILSKVFLSAENIKYLFGEVILKTSNCIPMKRKSIKKFSDNDETNEEFLNEGTLLKLMVALGALSNISIIPALDQIELVHQLFTILRKTFRNTNKTVNQDYTVSLLTNLMSVLLNVLSSIEHHLSPEIKESLSLKIRIEDISKCLYMFKHANLHSIILMVIKKLVKLELGLDHFNLTYFMNWVGSNVIPRDDQYSMDILNSVLEEILSVCIKNKQRSEDISNDQVKIIASFVKDCSAIPKHRLLMLYNNLIKSLSTLSSNEACSTSSILWIQLIFMVVNRDSNELSSNSNLNTSLIVPLLKKFCIQEQLLSMKKVILFLSQVINDPSKKRKFINDEISDSPIQKKRKITNVLGSVSGCRQSRESNVNEFAAVKEQLNCFNRNIDYATLMKTMMSYFKIQLNESPEDMNMVPSEVLIELISSLFSSMKVIGISQNEALCSTVMKNDITYMIRQIIETVGASLTENVYLTLLFNLIKNEYDESIKIKSLELLANKLRSMSHDKNIDLMNEELLNTVSSILLICKEVIISDNMTNSWDYSVCCATSLITIGFLEHKTVNDIFVTVYNTLLTTINTNLAVTSSERIILINIFLKAYVTGDNGDELKKVLQSALQVVSLCLEKKQLNNGEVESALALINSIVSREDVSSIGWELIESLLSYIFELTTIEYSLRRLSKASLEYQKNIRTKLSKIHDSNGLIKTCMHLYDLGCTKNNLTFISGSVSLFGCHLAFLNKSHIKLNNAVGKEALIMELLNMVQRSLSIKERIDCELKNDVRLCEEVSLKAVSHMYILFNYDEDMLDRIISWSEQSTEVLHYLQRSAVIYRLLHHMSTLKTVNVQAVIDFINNSDILKKVSATLNQLYMGVNQAKKRKVTNSGVIPFNNDDFIKEDPVECAELIKSIFQLLGAHLNAEHKLNLNLSVTEETKDLINNVCNTLFSLENFVDKSEYTIISEKLLTPVIVQLALNSYSDDTLLDHLCKSLCVDCSKVSQSVHLTLLKVLANMKEVMGPSFDMSIRGYVTSFLEDSKLHDDETIADMANEI